MMAAIVDKNGVCLAHVAAAQTHIRRRTKTAYPAMEGVLRRDQPQAEDGPGGRSLRG